MATQNVIDYPTFGNATSITFKHERNIHEPSAEYPNDDLSEKISALLNRPLWPLFPDGCYLNSKQARKLYRATQGITGLIHILNRSEHLSNENTDALDEPQQSRLWNALIELSEDVMRLADDMLQRSMDDVRR